MRRSRRLAHVALAAAAALLGGILFTTCPGPDEGVEPDASTSAELA